MAAEEKKSAPAPATAATYRVTHGTIVKGTDALGERTTATKGDLLSLPIAEAQRMLDVGVIEAV